MMNGEVLVIRHSAISTMPNLKPILAPAVERYRPAPLLWPPLNIGHRGAAGEAPENTFAAFELALRQGADGIEFDVHLSADGVPVVIHDARLERTTSASGRVGRETAAALRRLDAGSWFNRRFPARARARYAGLKIPLLIEALAWVRQRRCLAFLEIKQGRLTLYPRIEERVLDEIERSGVQPYLTVISFHRPTLGRLRQLDSRIPLGIDFTRPLLAVRRARALRATSVLPHWAFVSPRFIRRAHQAGLRVIAWDADQPQEMKRALVNGVDGVVTRYPALFAELRHSVPGLRSP